LNNIELYLLKFLFLQKNFNEYSSFIERKFLKDNSPDIYRLFEAICLWHGKFPGKDISRLEEFAVFYSTVFPMKNQREEETLHSLLSRLASIEVEDSVAKDFLTTHIQRTRATEASLVALDVAEGRKPFDALQAVLSDLEAIPRAEEAKSEFTVLSEDGGFPEPGLRWSLMTLNQSLGSLRKGDNGFIFARPEAGKTTFAISQGVHMAQQLVAKGLGPCIYATNEQAGEIILQRAVQACLGISPGDFFKHKKRAIETFKQRTNGQFLVYDKAFIQAREMDQLCKKYNPGLIVFDQLDKIKGFANSHDRDDMTLKQIYQWARELAKEYGPVIGVSQASVSAEGKKYLTMDDVDGSKTAKQGEADWILGIGASHQQGLEGIRHFNLSKNKLIGDPDTDPKKRHGKSDVKINPIICRYEDI
jgi:KaiC/GvpD/RAD55 family RecA-like ATPase